MRNIRRLWKKKHNRNIIGVSFFAFVGILAIVFSKIARSSKIVYPLKIRRDEQGDGGFGTSRKPPYNVHYGIDLVVSLGQPVFAPFPGTIKLITKALKDKDGFTGVKIETSNGLLVDVLYITPAVKEGQVVKVGQLIGYAQDITKAYGKIPEMRNHIHVEHYNSLNKQFLNPTSYYFPSLSTGSFEEPYIRVSDDFYNNYIPH